MTYPIVEKEWRRILARLRRGGAQKTCEHVLALIRTRPYPLAYTTRLVELLLKRGENEAAGKIVKAVDLSGSTHPLMDKLHSSWLWCIGKRRAALLFALSSAEKWKKPYIVHHVGTLYRCMADRENSDYYRKKSDHYWRLAHILVEQAERKQPKKLVSQRRNAPSGAGSVLEL